MAFKCRTRSKFKMYTPQAISPCVDKILFVVQLIVASLACANQLCDQIQILQNILCILAHLRAQETLFKSDTFFEVNVPFELLRVQVCLDIGERTCRKVTVNPLIRVITRCYDAIKAMQHYNNER